MSGQSFGPDPCGVHLENTRQHRPTSRLITVQIVLTAAGDETVVEPLHRDLPASQQPSHRTGWATLLAALQHVAH
jgi:hypothetical protein